MAKQISSKIDMQKEFDLQDLNKKEEPQTELTPDQVKQMIEYAEQKILYNKKLVKNIFNAEFFPRDGERNTKPSLTIPDQTLPIREILSRFAKGLPIGVNTPIYEGEDNDLPDPRTLDLVELQEMKEIAANELKAIAERQKQKHTKPKEEQKEAKSEESKPI